jgi:hypothetical protein
MRSLRPALPLVAGAVLALTACSTTPEPVAVAASPTPPAPSSSSPAPTPTPSATPTALPSFDRTATPATTSGSLKRASLPLARVLGSGWKARVDGGSVEDGYTGNGTPSVARDPEDTVIAVRPIGCAEESVYAEALPVPRFALEVDYRHRTGANGVGLALEFADAQAASEFFEVYTRSLALCRSGGSGATRVTVQASPGADAVATVTVDPLEQTTWRELAERSGRVVRLLAVEGTRAPVRPWGSVLADLRGA